MKIVFLIIKVLSIILSLQFLGCNNSTKKEVISYVESQPSFFSLRNDDWLTNKWIRKPENLLLIHETFKKIGYDNILYEILSKDYIIIQDIYISKKGYNLIDSLILTYKHRELGTKYYKEFWKRREKDKNDSVIFLIIRDIQSSYLTKLGSGILSLNANILKINDTLKTLLEIEYRNDTINRDLALEDFQNLKKYGFHQSAYNLLFECYKYQDINWNRDSLLKTLRKSKIRIDPWFKDDTK